MNILKILVGAAALILGRKLYWLFVGAVGFIFGMALATRFLSGQPDWVVLVVAVGAGLLGALLAVFLQHLTIGVAGFIGGGYITSTLLDIWGWDVGRLAWIPLLIGGIIGLVLVLTLFDWALVVLSSLSGASLIVEAIQLRQPLEAVLFAALLIVGIVIQAGWMRRDRRQPTAASAEE